jgi:hypothetical protein
MVDSVEREWFWSRSHFNRAARLGSLVIFTEVTFYFLLQRPRGAEVRKQLELEEEKLSEGSQLETYASFCSKLWNLKIAGVMRKKYYSRRPQGAGWDVEEAKSKIPIFTCWATNSSSPEPVSERGARRHVLSWLHWRSANLIKAFWMPHGIYCRSCLF